MTGRILNTFVSKQLRSKPLCIVYTLSRCKHTASKKWLTKREIEPKQQRLGYHVHGPSFSKSTRLAIAISPSVEEIWEHIQKCEKVDESVFWCAMKRCIQLRSADDLSSIMDFLLDDECMLLSKMKGPTIHHWSLLFQGLYKLNDFEAALEWFNIMISQEIKPNITIFNNLIALCCNNGDIERGLKLFKWIETFQIEYDKFTYAEMIRLYSYNNDIDKAQEILERAKDALVLNCMHYNYFLKGLSLQQRQDDDNKPKTGLDRMLCHEFEEELIGYLPKIMHDFYENMTKKDSITPDIKTYEYLLSILSFYGNSTLCLHYFAEATNVFGLRASVHIFNSLISCYCNEIALFSHQNESNSDVLYYEKHLDVMETNMDKILQVYEKCKALLIAPNIDTMKLLFHAMNARIMLSDNKIMDENDTEQDIEYTAEHNMKLLQTLYNEDIENYKIEIDEELAYYIMDCWSMLDIEEACKVYRTLCANKILNIWRNENEICLLKIPQRIYEDCWQFYLQYVLQHEMQKLLDLQECMIIIPGFEMKKGINEVQNEMEQVLNVKLTQRQTDDDNLCFVITNCKSVFTND